MLTTFHSYNMTFLLKVFLMFYVHIGINWSSHECIYITSLLCFSSTDTCWWSIIMIIVCSIVPLEHKCRSNLLLLIIDCLSQRVLLWVSSLSSPDNTSSCEPMLNSELLYILSLLFKSPPTPPMKLDLETLSSLFWMTDLPRGHSWLIVLLCHLLT